MVVLKMKQKVKVSLILSGYKQVLKAKKVRLMGIESDLQMKDIGVSRGTATVSRLTQSGAYSNSQVLFSGYVVPGAPSIRCC